MTISFNEVPGAWRVPGYVAEFDSSRAQQGAGIIEYKALLVGLMLPSGTAAPLTPYLITSAARAEQLFGAGSQLALMAAAWLQNNGSTALRAMAVKADSSAVPATATISLSGLAVAAITGIALNAILPGNDYEFGVSVTGDKSADLGSY